MQNRVPTYPGRVLLTPVAGQTNVYDLTRADEPTVEGTPLNKATLLSDAAVTALTGAGLSLTEQTPAEAFEKIAGIIGNNAEAKIELLNYVGTGTYGVNNPNTLSFSFDPDVVMLLGMDTGSRYTDFLGATSSYALSIPIATLTTSWKQYYGIAAATNNFYYGKYEQTTHTLSWYFTGNATSQANASGSTYYVLAFKGV